jgi:hypothetical protein
MLSQTAESTVGSITKVTIMSNTIPLGWINAIVVHAPTKPMWVSNVERALGQARAWLAAERPRRPIYNTHASYIEDALMSREMDRL